MAKIHSNRPTISINNTPASPKNRPLCKSNIRVSIEILLLSPWTFKYSFKARGSGLGAVLLDGRIMEVGVTVNLSASKAKTSEMPCR